MLVTYTDMVQNVRESAIACHYAVIVLTYIDLPAACTSKVLSSLPSSRNYLSLEHENQKVCQAKGLLKTDM